LKQTTMKTLMLIPAVLLLAAIVALLIPDSVIATFSGKIAPTGSIIIYVQDGNTKKGLQNACVSIPETGQSFYTDENGKTDTIKVPIIEDTEYKGIFPKPWGEITILVYSRGYVDCAIFHVNIWENQTRNGPTVLLFPTSGDGSNQPFTLTEGPNRIWVNELLNKFRPADVH
jgi:hypothetical protein